MISDKKLAKISLGISIAGIIGIYLVTAFAGPGYSSISQINSGMAGEHVTVNATVTSFTNSNGNVFLTLDDGTGSIKAVMFERTARNTDAYGINEGEKGLFIGQIDIYKGELEIILSSVIVWK